MTYVRSVKTTSGATTVQIVWSSRRGSRKEFVRAACRYRTIQIRAGQHILTKTRRYGLTR